MLRTDDLVAGYLGAPVVRGVSLSVAPGEVLCLLGANGAGKSTIAKSLAGLLAVRGGTVTVGGRDITAAPADDRVRAGISLVPESRHLFPNLTVRDNLVLGGYTRSAAERAESFARTLESFPQLDALLGSRAGNLSGGEQQMLAIGRALMARPRYLVLDEPSLGLAPRYVDLILGRARKLADGGVGVLLIEQNAGKALAVGDRAAVVDTGRITVSGAAADLRRDTDIVASYLGGVA